MTPGRRMAMASAALTLIMIVVYLGLISRQGNQPAVWFVAGLAVAAVLAGYGSFAAAPRHRPALFTAGALQLALGLLGILSIGLPIVAAGVLAVVAAGRSGTPT
ncbi:hypothetical protein BJ973_008767 [Actinoplanes tereljensis]|uniref:Uncharacterized protein n=1 Tax=Paractinoplanes tereljensis TaxID=571912 RepID=A0A919TPR2_9ACTN|nr:hypothetical protein [Actinoplanes tereljensis]GIF18273.1 hypothetical protein Ate02nite_10030 [Actinoplanes tereljensis]